MLDIYHSLSVKCLNCCRFLQHDSFSHVCVSVLGQWRWIKMQTECRRTVVHWVVQLSHQLLWCTLNWKLMCCDSTVFKELRLWDFLLVRRRAADVFMFFLIATARSLTSTKSGLDRFLEVFSAILKLCSSSGHISASLFCLSLMINVEIVSFCKLQICIMLL